MKSKLVKFHHIKNSPAYILAWIGFIIGILIAVWGVVYCATPVFLKHSIYGNAWSALWFGHFQQFTIQTNTLLIIFYGLWLFGYRTKIMRTNNFLVFCTSYIILVSMVAWFMMTAVFSLSSSSNVDGWLILDHILVHLLTVVIFIVFFAFAIKYPKPNETKEMKYLKYWLLAGIYPCVYFLYAIIINFIKLPPQVFSGSDTMHGQYYLSIYASLTNYNRLCVIPIFENGTWNYEVISGSGIVNDHGSLLRLLIVPFVIGFWSLEFLTLSYLNNRANVFYKYRTIYI